MFMQYLDEYLAARDKLREAKEDPSILSYEHRKAIEVAEEDVKWTRGQLERYTDKLATKD